MQHPKRCYRVLRKKVLMQNIDRFLLIGLPDRNAFPLGSTNLGLTGFKGLPSLSLPFGSDLALVLVWPNFSFAGNVTMPSSLVADTSTFVTLSDSGTTPSISGYTGTLLVSVTASDGNIKVTTTTNLKRASGYCGYSSDSDDSSVDDMYWYDDRNIWLE